MSDSVEHSHPHSARTRTPVDRTPADRTSVDRTSADRSPARHPVTPDGRYFVVRARLWRCSDPSLAGDERERLVKKLMRARRDVARARRLRDRRLADRARVRVQAAKEALGERGPVWWTDAAPDYTRHLARNTPYREWYEALLMHGATRRRQSRRTVNRQEETGNDG